MSLGLPSHMEQRTVSRSFGDALNAVAYTCLFAALVTTVVFQVANPRNVLWPAAVAVLPMLALLYWSARTRETMYSVGYLIVGTASVFWFALTFSSQSAPILSSDAFSLALPKIALVMVGGSAPHILPRLAWCTAGYLLAEGSVAGALAVSGHPYEFGETSFLAYAVTSVIFIAASFSRRSSRRTQPKLHRAAREEQLAAMRYRIEVKAAALMHDTVLSDLAAIAASEDRRLVPTLRQQVERDLELLIGGEWLAEDEPVLDEHSQRRWQESALFASIEESRALGLQVESTGDFGAISRLDGETSRSLGLAVKQCLVNVLRHSGVTRAEVAIFDSEYEVSVMVIDAGRGFSEADSEPDRLGIRQSVRQRIESVGGSVQIWSTPGRGTSVMIRVPATAASVDAESVEAR
jgi:signal transduction histidine kinase